MSEKNFVFDVKHQETYSRGELLLRSFFAPFYIGIPHYFLLFFIAIGVSFVSFIAFFAVLFTGKYPKGMFDFVVKYMRWDARVSTRFLNLRDGYPKFGLEAEDEGITFEVPYPEKLSRGLVLLRAFFGFFYVLIPHGFVLYFRLLWSALLMFIAWFAVLFTGKYPQGMFDFVVGTYRWGYRVGLYMSLMTDEYPKFSGKA